MTLAAARLRARIASGPLLVLDGGTGSELERLGIRAELPLWSAHALLEAPHHVLGVHRAYVAAGAELLTANTFRTQRRTLERGHHGERSAGLTAFAVELARRACEGAAREVFVLGSAAPLEDCYHPERVPPAAELAAEHVEHAAHLVAAGVDAVLVETMNTVREALAATRAAREAGAAVLVSFVCDEAARLLSGEPLLEAIEAIAPLEPLALGVNCMAPDAIERCLPVLAGAGLPVLVYPNLDTSGATAAGDEADARPERFAARGRRFAAAGARIVGGCCGTRAEHIEALAEALH